MGYIFIAREKLQGTKVAIKVLPPEGSQKGRRRFLREIKFASTLQHSYILPIKEWGEANGLLYFVMPHVARGSLKARIDRQGRLSIPEALRLATEIAEGLDHAHRSGLIHRDLKPSNILLSGGLDGDEEGSGLEHEHAAIADFGLAKLVAPEESEDLTTLGLVVGTPSYMSPEQAEGRAEAGSDIYSLGCVLFEMLVGRPPYTGRSKVAILTSHAAKPIPSLRAHRPDAPLEVEEIVTRALAKAPGDRYPTALSMASALSVASRSVSSSEERGWTGYSLRSPAVIGGSIALVVMPFQNMGGDPTKDYFAEGMTAELISALTRAEGIRVASRTSVYALQAAGLDLETIGERLGAPLVIMGSIQWLEKRIRVTVELIQVSDLYNIWSETYSRHAEDVFSIQETIAEAVVRRIQPQLSRQGALLVKRYTQSVRAYNDYLRGLHAWNRRTSEGMQQAIEHYQSALRADGDYALPHAGLADVYLALSQFQHSKPREVLPQAEAAARQALSLDPKLPQALASMGHVLDLFHWNDRAAEHYYRRALDEDADYATAHAWLADMLMLIGRADESLAHSARALQLEPFSIAFAFEAANLRYRMRQFEEAEERYRLIMKQAPQHAMASVFLVFSLLGQGKSKQAVDTAQEALTALGSVPILEMAYGYAQARLGRRDQAEAVIKRQEARRQSEFIPALNTALVLVALEERDAAFEWLEATYDERSVLMIYLPADAYLDPVRSDPRFEALLERVGYGRAPRNSSAASTGASPASEP